MGGDTVLGGGPVAERDQGSDDGTPPADPLLVAVVINVDTSASNAGNLTIGTTQTPLVSGLNRIFHLVSSGADVQVQAGSNTGTNYWWFTGSIYTIPSPV